MWWAQNRGDPCRALWLKSGYWIQWQHLLLFLLPSWSWSFPHSALPPCHLPIPPKSILATQQGYFLIHVLLGHQGCAEVQRWLAVASYPSCRLTASSKVPYDCFVMAVAQAAWEQAVSTGLKIGLPGVQLIAIKKWLDYPKQILNSIGFELRSASFVQKNCQPMLPKEFQSQLGSSQLDEKSQEF